MSRTILLAIVLALAVGPNTALLCKAWCEPQAADAACHHDGATPDAMLTASDLCDDVELSPGAVLQDEVRRGVSDPQRSAANDIEFTPGFQLSRSTTDARPGASPGRARSFDDRPRSAVLRI